ncbi:MAG: hypothetical protein H0W84_09515, partial [Bacteroidetes bacterium]|nr:hypothetical protein [Bacteroidota bacterium]
MKKIYTLILTSAFALLQVTGNAVTINVSANSNNTFTPNTFSAVVGDVVVWTNAGGAHNVKSITTPLNSVPAGAAAINSADPLTTYSYTITVAGSYGY